MEVTMPVLRFQKKGPYPSNMERFYIHKKATWCGYKSTGLMLEHFLLKELHNRNVVTLNVLPSPIHMLLHANLPVLEAMLQVVV
jgi:hypothetical protein